MYCHLPLRPLCQKSKRVASRRPIGMNVSRPDGSGTWRLNMSLTDMEDAWRRGLHGPLRTAGREISRLVERMKLGIVERPLVVISGGTARNPAVKSRLLSLCEVKGLSTVFTDQFNVPIAYDSAKVAMAAVGFATWNLLVDASN
ncbi:hypothetical protein CHGG_05411 [Chaetomium globosum CBS 148.51]|uniref:Uncharacterized protein n=1 Tax=Chaetomium globosum (strain ATCC 6205 / CBS 148.51 / DSM 1962 / NBRC 6347 / NRRL 1970) TaxID=306901 RepID=Q2H7F4_CHAGB|nr:uncharacterized protein CHGG_05411 [Chaetomium globosum CBS 148.51]EAQ88792.1 hypothetical protein CHGG_05411 [Chaetomium globosum CBS 148.51]